MVPFLEFLDKIKTKKFMRRSFQNLNKFIYKSSIYPKHKKSSSLSLENPWKLVESHFIAAPNVKKCEKQY